MKVLVRASMTLPVLVAALALGGAAHARSPSPTPTSTPTDTVTPSPTWTPWPTATPTLPPETVAKFSGEVWLDDFGRYDHAGWVTARIGDSVCGVAVCATGPGPCLRIPIDPAPLVRAYNLDVVPANEKPGCGYEGAPITFFVGDTQAKQTAIWHAGASQELNLSTGPPIAVFRGEFTLAFEPSEPIGVDMPAGMIAYVGNNACGQAINGIWRGRDPQGRVFYWYSVLVRSNEQQQGCGVEGDEVVFTLIWNGKPGNVNVGKTVAVAGEKGVWQAWDGTPPELNLTMYPVGTQLANVGDGPTRSGEVPWTYLAFGLSVAGALGIAAAVALRRRASTN